MSLGSLRFRLLVQADDDEPCRECATNSDFSRFCSVPGIKRRFPLSQRMAGNNPPYFPLSEVSSSPATYADRSARVDVLAERPMHECNVCRKMTQMTQDSIS
jgi:hypothetical protein